MIFSDKWRDFDAEWMGTGFLQGLIPCNGRNLAICVYQGVQPPISEYITNYDSAYNLSSPDILQVITYYNGQYSLSRSGGSLFVTDPDALYFTQALKSFRPGTATWASVSPVHFYIEDNPSGYYFLSDEQVTDLNGKISEAIATGYYVGESNLLDNPNGFVSIVPVSDMTDNGVIKFRSVEFSDPDETDEERAIDMSVTISIVDQE